MPKVSVLLPTHNGATYIIHAIYSVLWQTYNDFEFIIINDWSTDWTEEIVKGYQKDDPRIIYIKNEENIGLIKTLNNWLKLAKGEYIARIDDDDFWQDHDKLLKQVRFLDENPEYWLVGTSIVSVNEQWREIGKVSSRVSDETIRKNLLRYNQFVHPSIMMRKSVLEHVWWYDEKALYVEDYELWLRIGKISKFHNLPDYSTRYMIRKGSISWQKQFRQKRNTLKTVDVYKRQIYKRFGFQNRILSWARNIFLIHNYT